MNDLWRVLTLQDSNTRTAMLGVSVLGIACGIVGTLAVLRRRALVGDAVAHASLPGVCAAYMLTGMRELWSFLLGALVFGILGAAFVAAVRKWTRVKEDAAIAVVIGSFFGLGIAMSGVIQRSGGSKAGIDSFIFGRAASMVRADAMLVLTTAAVAIATVLIFYKEFKLLCFDHDFAGAIGRRTGMMDFLLLALVAICAVAGLPAVGVILVVGLLVIAPAAARFWSEKLGTVMVLSGIFGGIAALIGTALSASMPAPVGRAEVGWPTGPTVTLTLAAIFLISFIFAPSRGVLAAAFRRVSVRRELRDAAAAERAS